MRGRWVGSAAELAEVATAAERRTVAAEDDGVNRVVDDRDRQRGAYSSSRSGSEIGIVAMWTVERRSAAIGLSRSTSTVLPIVGSGEAVAEARHAVNSGLVCSTEYAADRHPSSTVPRERRLCERSRTASVVAADRRASRPKVSRRRGRLGEHDGSQPGPSPPRGLHRARRRSDPGGAWSRCCRDDSSLSGCALGCCLMELQCGCSCRICCASFRWPWQGRHRQDGDEVQCSHHAGCSTWTRPCRGRS